MARDRRTAESVERLFGMLLGGLTSGFLAALTFLSFVFDRVGTGSQAPYVPALFGIGCLTLLMVAGVLLSDFLWAATTFLFASGFTALWSLALSFSAEWDTPVLVAWGVALAVGAGAGWLCFGRSASRALPGEGSRLRGAADGVGLSVVDPWDSGTSVSSGG